jgi:hypothetical protein
MPMLVMSLMIPAVVCQPEVAPLVDAPIEASPIFTNDTAPEAPSSNHQLGLIKGLGAAALAVEVIIAGFVPRLLKTLGGQWIGLANVRTLPIFFFRKSILAVADGCYVLCGSALCCNWQTCKVYAHDRF